MRRSAAGLDEPERRGRSCRDQLGSRTGSSGDEEDAVGEALRDVGGELERRAASCRCRPARSASAAGSSGAGRAASASSVSRPTKLVSWVGRLFGRRSSERIGGKSVPQAVDDELVRSAPAGGP